MIQSDPNSRLYELTRRISLRSYDRIAAGILSILLVIVLGACRDSGSSQTGNTDPNTTTDSSGDFSITLHVDGPRQVTITWDNPPEYYLFYKLLDYYSVVYQSGAVAVPSTSGFSYTFNYLSPQSTYCYRAEVMALYQVLWTYQWIGWSSAEVCATTPPDTTAPPPGTTALAVSSTQPAYGETSVMVNTAITVTFSENIDPRTVDSSTFFVTGPSGTVSGSISIAAWAATFRPDINLAYLTDYQVTVTTGVKDRWGHALPSSYIWTFTTEVLPDSTPPAAPSGLSAVADANGQILLSWDPASDNTGVEGYRIYRDGSFVKSVPSTTETDIGLYIKTQYCYVVSAYDVAGNESQKSSTICATTSDLPSGSIGSWGWNVFGQLGDGTTVSKNRPGRVVSLATVSDIAAGMNHSVALKTDGTVWAWGDNSSCQLGDGITDIYTDRTSPVQVAGLANVIAVTAKVWNTLALKSDGTVWAWGGSYGSVPAQIAGLNNIIAVAAGGPAGGYALRLDGTVWGLDLVQIPNLSGVIAIAAGELYALALTSDGTVWAWGMNYNGQLGCGICTHTTDPVRVVNITSITAIAAGQHHSLALRSDGTVWAWGSNLFGELGDTTTNDSNIPVKTVNVSGIAAIAAGSDHSLALGADGTIWAWGSNGGGQIGDGTTTHRYSAVETVNLSNVTAIRAGGSYSMALK